MRAQRWFYIIPLRMRSLLRRDQVDKELDEALRNHVELRTQQFLAQGMTLEEARRRALLALHGVERAKEECRDARGLTWFHDVAQDLRFGLRTFRKAPGFTAVAVLTLALGIGSVTLIVSAVYGVILKTFPFPHADQVTSFEIQDLMRPNSGRESLTMPEFLFFRAHSRAFQDFSGEYGGFGSTPLRYTAGGATYEFDADFLSVNSFRLFGVKPLVGRLPTPENVKAGATPVFVMGEKFWRSQFNSDPTIVGKSFTLNGVPRTLVGIMPRRFRWAWVDIWVPFSVVPAVVLSDPSLKDMGLYTVGRRKPGVSLKQAAADLDVVAHQYARIAPRLYPKRFTVTATTLSDRVTGGFKRLIYPLLAAVLLLLLIACSNTANLLLSRATAREGEIAVRAALGATRPRLLRQLLLEGLLLAVAGCAVGCWFAWLGIKEIVPLIPYNAFPQEAVIALNGPVLAAALIVAIMATVLCGLVPALHAVGGELQPRVVGAGRPGSGHRHGRLRSALVVAEVALSIILLVAAGLMMRTFWRSSHFNLGFETHNILEMQLSFPRRRPAAAAEKAQDESAKKPGASGNSAAGERAAENRRDIVARKILQRVAALPGVAAAALIFGAPASGSFMESTLTIPGKTHAQHWLSELSLCSEGYFNALRVRLLAGRLLSRSDVAGARPVAVVSQTFARRYFGSGNPIGQSVHFAATDQLPGWKGKLIQIIGVVADAKDGPGAPIGPEAYLPFTIFGANGLTLLARTRVIPGSLIPTVQKTVWAVDSQVALLHPTTVEATLGREYLSSPRFESFILATFAGIALALLAAGIFSVMAYSVSLRRHEIGVRMACGAEPEDIWRMVLKRGMRLTAIGVVIGVA
ncbi:MAG: ADOP family duplicated permease, partial [Terriglobales bacterium]